jgi:thiol-disulfide isomerase/thioredoxin/outer membrane lipoprotein-sorting protein
VIYRISKFVSSALAFFLFSGSAIAAPVLSAKLELQKFSHLLESGRGIAYTSKISIDLLANPQAPASSGGDSPLISKVIVEKSGKAYITLSGAGSGEQRIYSDGKTVTVYDTESSKYSSAPSASSNAASVRDIFRAAKALYFDQPSTLINTEIALLFPNDYSLSQIAPGPLQRDVSLGISMKAAKVGGEPVNVITQRYKTPQGNLLVVYTLSQSTHLPIAIHEESSTVSGQKVISFDERFSSFRVLTSSDTAENFAFVPPVGASKVAAVPASGGDEDQQLLPIGTRAPDVMVTASDGTVVRLSDFAGKVIVLDFWATWCGPCQESLPHTDAIAKIYQGKGVVFLPICTMDDKSAFITWQKKHSHYAMPFYFDSGSGTESPGAAADLYKVAAIPSQYVIGKDGRIAYTSLGYPGDTDPSENALADAIKKALDVRSPRMASAAIQAEKPPPTPSLQNLMVASTRSKL